MAMRKKFNIILLCLFFWSQHSFSQIKEDYDYPIDDPINASFTFSLLKGKYKGWKTYVKVRENDERKPLYYKGPGRYPINCFFHRDGKKRPLVYVLTGLGSGVRGSGAVYIANQFYRKGNHVIVLPSSFTDTFVHTVSTYRYVGQVRLDAKDQYRALLKVQDFVKRFGLPVTDQKIFGYSFGAAVGSFLAEKDKPHAKNPLNISKYILMNPPIDLLEGLATVDEFRGTKIKRKVPKFLSVLKVLFDFRTRFGIDDIEDKLEFKNGVKPHDLKYFIGLSLTASLGNVIYMTQEKYDAGVLKKRQKIYRLKKAKGYTLKEYVNKIIKAFYTKTKWGKQLWRREYGTPTYSLQRLRERNSLYSLRKNFQEDERVYLIHNTDDFLLHDRDVEFLNKTMGDRFFLYPKGGHVGNVWYPENLELYHSIFKGEI